MATSKIPKYLTGVTAFNSAFDMNDIRQTGLYFADIDSANITNWPHEDGWLLFIVIASGGTVTAQIVLGGRTSNNANKKCSYMRYYLNGWKDWLKFAPTT